MTEKVMRDYDTVDVDADEQESPFTFTMGGRAWHCRPVEAIPWAMVEEYFIHQSQGNVAGMIVNVDSFLSGVLQEDEAEAFIEWKHRPKGGPTYKVMAELIGDLTKEVFGTPTERPTPSRAGSQRKGSSSKGGSSAKGSRSRQAG